VRVKARLILQKLVSVLSALNLAAALPRGAGSPLARSSLLARPARRPQTGEASRPLVGSAASKKVLKRSALRCCMLVVCACCEVPRCYRMNERNPGPKLAPERVFLVSKPRVFNARRLAHFLLGESGS